jgi:hypothetical protein
MCGVPVVDNISITVLLAWPLTTFEAMKLIAGSLDVLARRLDAADQGR